MANFNKVILAGNLTRDPQLSYLPSKTPVVEFGMAINRRWRSQDGQQREETCFVDCRAFGRTAEIINQYMAKGRPILVDGRLTYDAWEGKDGQKRSRLRVTVENFQFLGTGQNRDGGDTYEGAASPSSSASGPYNPPPQTAPKYDAPEPAPPDMANEQGPDDIPF